MNTLNKQVILLKEDYNRLSEYVKSSKSMPVSDKKNYENLAQEIGQAIVVDKEDFPENTVRLNSTAIIKDKDTNRVMALTVVLPHNADLKKGKISVLAPLGAALIGFQKGEQINWEVPSGTKNLFIMEVYNSRALVNNH